MEVEEVGREGAGCRRDGNFASEWVVGTGDFE